MKNTCCVCWNRKYISGRITGSREGSGKQAFLLSKRLKALTSLHTFFEQTAGIETHAGRIYPKKRKCHFDRQLRSRENPYCNCRSVTRLSQGMKVKFYTAAGLINELLAAQQEYRLNKLEKQWLAPHLVILDE